MIISLLSVVQRPVSARLVSITIPGEGSVTYGQYQGGVPQQIVLPGGVVKTMAYDPLSGMVSNRVLDVSGNPVMDRTYQRNRAGTITGMNTEHGDYTYSYDQVDQLTDVGDPVLPDQSFSYDPAGNRLTSGSFPKPGTGDPEVRTYAVNDLNQYLSVTSASSAVSLSYDLNGNVTQEVVDGVSQVFRWDGENRLVGYSNSETGVSASYYYDPFGRRLRKVVNGVTNWYVYADEGLVMEMDGAGNEIRSYGYAPDSPWMNDPLYMRVPGIGATNIYYFVNDHLGAPQKLIAKNGEVVWNMESEAFGQATVSPDSTITNNFRFSSQYFDEESMLHYNTQRHYERESGRYVSRDPKGEIGGRSLYAFVNNDPLDNIDPVGLDVTVTTDLVSYHGTVEWFSGTRMWNYYLRDLTGNVGYYSKPGATIQSGWGNAWAWVQGSTAIEGLPIWLSFVDRLQFSAHVMARMTICGCCDSGEVTVNGMLTARIKTSDATGTGYAAAEFDGQTLRASVPAAGRRTPFSARYALPKGGCITKAFEAVLAWEDGDTSGGFGTVGEASVSASAGCSP